MATESGGQLMSGQLSVKSGAITRFFQKAWKERSCRLTKDEFIIIKGDKGKDTNTTERRSEHHVLGDRPKLVVGAGGAPGHSFLLVCGGRQGIAKEIPLGAASHDLLQAWISSFLILPGGANVEFAQEPQPLANVTNSVAVTSSTPSRAQARIPASPPKVNTSLGLCLSLDSSNKGLVVIGIEPRSSAERSGLVKEGHILTHVDGVAVAGEEGLAVADSKMGALQALKALPLCFIRHPSNEPYQVSLIADSPSLPSLLPLSRPSSPPSPSRPAFVPPKPKQVASTALSNTVAIDQVRPPPFSPAGMKKLAKLPLPTKNSPLDPPPSTSSAYFDDPAAPSAPPLTPHEPAGRAPSHQPAETAVVLYELVGRPQTEGGSRRRASSMVAVWEEGDCDPKRALQSSPTRSRRASTGSVVPSPSAPAAAPPGAPPHDPRHSPAGVGSAEPFVSAGPRMPPATAGAAEGEQGAIVVETLHSPDASCGFGGSPPHITRHPSPPPPAASAFIPHASTPPERHGGAARGAPPPPHDPPRPPLSAAPLQVAQLGRTGSARAADASGAGRAGGGGSGAAAVADAPEIVKKARMGRQQTVKAILDRESSAVHAKDGAGNSVLIAAASNGHLNTVKLVVKRGADVNLRNGRGCTALHLALKYGYTDVAQFLVASNADISARDENGLNCAQVCHPKVYEAQAKQLERMGFSERDEALAALLKCEGDVHRAVERLADGGGFG